jgi:hypothetical protein
MQTSRLTVIDNNHVELAKNTLRSASVKATIRKGSGSCRCQMYVTPQNGNDAEVIKSLLASVGFSLDYVDPAWNNYKMYFEVGVING